MKVLSPFALILSILVLSCQEQAVKDASNSHKPYRLWYQQPAEYFEESLVLGNGKMGASVFGGISTDSIYLNDATLWSGEPVNPAMNPDAHQFVPKVREALANENYQQADELIRNIQGSFSQSYAPLGTIYMSFDHHSKKVKNYQRSLDISTAEAKISYQVDDITYNREYFISNPDQVMVITLNCSKDEALNFNIDFGSLLKFETFVEDSVQKTRGYAPYHAEPNYRGDIKDPVRFDPERGIHFANYVKVRATDGEVSYEDSTLRVNKASFAEILVSVATSFNGFDKDPVKDGKPYQTMAAKQLNLASDLSLATLRQNHQNDYQRFFNRLQLDLNAPDSLDIPTDQRLIRYSKGLPDRGLEELYFHFGRYLLISSSRTSQVPANLQGIWNPYLRPPWSSNYTVNINVEENYWLAEVANLSECHQPLLSWIENLAMTGEVSAATFYGAEGWAVGHNSDIWAMTNPVGDFGEGHPVWANWNMGGAWLSTHLWEHYAFTSDKEFLKEKAYPLMKGAAEFCLDMLIEDMHGKLITSPSTSPENLYKTPDGYKGATFYGATADLAIIKELFIQTIDAAEILKIDKNFQQRLIEKLAQLHPYQVGKSGHLQEWYHDWEDVDPQHRHQSHLIGLYPGNHITTSKTPELAAACEKTLTIKGDVSTGWSQGWRINLWARLKNGNRAHKLFQNLLRYVDPSGLNYNYSNGGGTYPNLFDAHPPFQIDGNFGGAAGVLEMLVQSTIDTIEILPALPDLWSEGQLKGVKTRGGFEIEFNWVNKKVEYLEVYAEKGGTSTIVCNGIQYPISLAAGEKMEVKL